MLLDCIFKVVLLFRKQKINTDSFSFKLVYRFLSTFLITCSVLTFSNNYFGNQLHCLFNEHGEEVGNANCWTQGTWVYAKIDEYELFRKQSQRTKMEDSQSFRRKVEVSPGVRSKYDEEPERVHHFKYAFIPLVYVFLAASCHIGRYCWRRMEGGVLEQIIRDLNNPKLEEETANRMILEAANAFINSIRHHRPICNVYGVLVFVNLVVLFIHQLVLYFLFSNGDIFFGYTAFAWITTDYRDWPYELAVMFPQVSKCIMKGFGISGNLVEYDGLCFLVSNKINLITFALHWWLVLFLIPLTSLELINHLCKCFCRWRRSWEARSVLNAHSHSEVTKVIEKLDYGSAFVLSLLAKNISKDFVRRILLEVQSEYETNMESINRVRSGLD